MKLKLQKKLASQVSNASKKRVKISPEGREQVKQAITKADIVSLIREGIIKVAPKKGTSRHRARARIEAKKKGRKRGLSTRKGTKTARSSPKREWINKVRLQRKVLKTLKLNNQLDKKDYKMLYLRVKGGFFRSKKHLLLYAKQNGLLKEK
jgi:large subunit ribosomal protein L19e